MSITQASAPMNLVEKIRKARETNVEIGGFTFTVRRPTDIEAMHLRAAESLGDLVRFVVGWQGVQEIDVVPGGAAVDLPFNAGVAAEWLADRPDLLKPLVDSVIDTYHAHVKALEGAAKNRPENGAPPPSIG